MNTGLEQSLPSMIHRHGAVSGLGERRVCGDMSLSLNEGRTMWSHPMLRESVLSVFIILDKVCERCGLLFGSIHSIGHTEGNSFTILARLTISTQVILTPTDLCHGVFVLRIEGVAFRVIERVSVGGFEACGGAEVAVTVSTESTAATYRCHGGEDSCKEFGAEFETSCQLIVSDVGTLGAQRQDDLTQQFW